MFGKRFSDVIARQLDLFESDYAELLERIDRARDEYDAAGREDAEEKFGEYQELVAEGTEILTELRDNYASTLDDDAADAYEISFNIAVARRFGDLALELEEEDADEEE